jgi:protein TonB
VRTKNYRDAKVRADGLIRFALTSVAAAKDVQSVLAEASACRSLASAGLGDKRGAEWDWYVATALDATVTDEWRKSVRAARQFVSNLSRRDRDIHPPTAKERVVAPIATTKLPPEYPERASALKLEQIVEIELIIDTAGMTREPRLVTTDVDPALAFAAFEAVKQWVFRPGTVEGKPVVTLYDLKVKFKQPPA